MCVKVISVESTARIF